jgi:hypothetical protein
MPLIYDDESQYDTSVVERKYFSYIGTIAEDHSFDCFLKFIEECAQNGSLNEYEFLIATKSKITIDKDLQNIIDTGRLIVIEGEPLSNESINYYYKRSLVVWNAYKNTTQSGVLAKSFMFGTPAIVLWENISEFVKDKWDVVAIHNNKSYDEIYKALLTIISDYTNYSKAARKCFLGKFYYRNYHEKLAGIIHLCSALHS